MGHNGSGRLRWVAPPFTPSGYAGRAVPPRGRAGAVEGHLRPSPLGLRGLGGGGTMGSAGEERGSAVHGWVVVAASGVLATTVLVAEYRRRRNARVLCRTGFEEWLREEDRREASTHDVRAVT
jgi:hypothetical protein